MSYSQIMLSSMTYDTENGWMNESITFLGFPVEVHTNQFTRII